MDKKYLSLAVLYQDFEREIESVPDAASRDALYAIRRGMGVELNRLLERSPDPERFPVDTRAVSSDPWERAAKLFMQYLRGGWPAQARLVENKVRIVFRQENCYGAEYGVCVKVYEPVDDGVFTIRRAVWEGQLDDLTGLPVDVPVEMFPRRLRALYEEALTAEALLQSSKPSRSR